MRHAGYAEAAGLEFVGLVMAGYGSEFCFFLSTESLHAQDDQEAAIRPRGGHHRGGKKQVRLVQRRANGP